MIATLSGTVSEKILDVVIIDVQGVGYSILVTNEDYGHLAPGNDVKVYIHEHIRENSYDLFGFIGLDTKLLFERLLEVSGVGPKMALSVLSVGAIDAVRQAIAGGDTKLIQQASGVGKRVAERIVVDLKDKVGLEGIDLASTGMLQAESLAQKDEALAALVALGYSSQDASVYLAKVPTDLSTEERIKLALKRS
jgi:Holliday junction DNA helicase RuvA